MTPPPSRWLRCYRPRPPAATKLICLPHAGGSASAFRAWPDRAGPDIEIHAVQYPGREDRLTDPFIDRMDALVEAVTAEIAAAAFSRFALFGHSMGGAVAYEVAVRLRALGLPGPAHLFISGRQPPEHHRSGTLHTKDDQALVDELVRLRPANAELMAEPALARIVLPVVRNDYRLIETYRPAQADPLRCPITALVGEADTELTVAESAAWAGLTTGRVQPRTFPGDHFYLVDHRAAVIATVVDALHHTDTPARTRRG